MTASSELRIHPTNSHYKAWLSLKGTILSYKERTRDSETLVDIPVELITITERYRFMGQRLVIAMASLVLSIAMGGAIAGIPYYSIFYETPKHEGIYVITGLCIMFIPFLILIVRFFFKQRTAILWVNPDGPEISFWILKKDEQTLNDLLSGIRMRQALVEDEVPFPLSSTSAFTIERPWKKTIAQMWLFALPAIFTQKPWWLLLSLLPLGKFLWDMLYLMEQPSLYRKAYRAGLKQDWDLALAYAKQLCSDDPEYESGHELLYQVHIRRSEINEASAVLGTIRANLDPDIALQMEEQLVLRKRISDRKKAGIFE